MVSSELVGGTVQVMSHSMALVDMFDLTLWLVAGLVVAWWRRLALKDHSPRQACCKTHGLSPSRFAAGPGCCYGYQMGRNQVLSQLRVTVVAGHSGDVGRSGSRKHSSEEGSLDLCMRHHHGG